MLSVAESICLDRVEVNRNLVKFYYSVSEGLKRYFNADVMFLEYEQDMSTVPLSILTIPFVSCMAGLSWLTNSMLFVDEIDRSFYDSFFRIKRAYQELFYNYTLKGVLVPSILRNNNMVQSSEALLLFGGGVDCHCSYVNNKERIKSLCNIYGWLPTMDANSKVDESDKQSVEAFAAQEGIKADHVRSNFAFLFNDTLIKQTFKFEYQMSYWYSFLHSLAFISISVPLCYENGMSNIIIGSSFTKGRTNVKCGSYVTTDSEFCFAGNGVVNHDGFNLDRQAKVKVLVEYQKSLGKPYPIQVCSFNDHNCCKCEKCFRSIIAIIAEGGDPKDFGFHINGDMKTHWESVLKRDAAFWGIGKEAYYHSLAKQRMRENYVSIKDKEFVDWFLNFDFTKANHKAKLRYYKENFFSIVMRRLKVWS